MDKQIKKIQKEIGKADKSAGHLIVMDLKQDAKLKKCNKMMKKSPRGK